MIKIVLQSIAVLIALAAIGKTYYGYKKNNENIFSVIIWIIVWFFVIIVSALPDVFYHLANSLNRDNIGVGTFIGIAFVLLLFVIYRLYLKVNLLEYKLKELVTKIAIRDSKK